MLASNVNLEAEESKKKKVEMINMQNSLIQKQNGENEKLKELIKQKEESILSLEKNKQIMEEKKQKIEEENTKYAEKTQKQEEKLMKAIEKLKKYKEELTTADEEYKEAQNYIKKQKESKEALERQLKEAEDKLHNYENLLTNKTNKALNVQTVKPSEFNKNVKPTLNKYPPMQNVQYIQCNQPMQNIQNKENFSVYYEEEEMKKTNNFGKNPREIMNKNNSKEFFGDNKITEIQKEYIKNIYDEKYKANNNEMVNKKRKMDNEMELVKRDNKVDFPKSFGFKQMKFL